jgi:hypothetical protein
VPPVGADAPPGEVVPVDVEPLASVLLDVSSSAERR